MQEKQAEQPTEPNEMQRLLKELHYWQDLRGEYITKLEYAQRQITTYFALINDLQTKVKEKYERTFNP